MRLTKLIFGVTLALILSACTSLVEKGDKLYGQGMYLQAAEFYEKALVEDPDDFEAKQRLTETRNKIIDRGLIEVRMLRLSANYHGAASKLESLLSKQNKWHVETLGAQAETQRDEIIAVEAWLKAEAKQLTSLPYPDPFMWFEYEFKNLIANAQLGSELNQYKMPLAQTGKQQCAVLAKQVSGQRFFLHNFTTRYCSMWRQRVDLKVDAIDKSRFTGIEFINRERLRTNQAQSHRHAINSSQNSFRRDFQVSPWFSDSGAKPIKLTFRSSAQYVLKTTPLQQQKRYVLTELKPDPADVSKKIAVDVEKVFVYKLKQYQESYSINVSYSADLHGLKLKNSESGNYSNTTRGHNIEFEKAGISPLFANYMDQVGYFQQHLTKLNADFNQDLTELWKQRYCVAANQSTLAEQALRCAEVEAQNDFVNRWFKSQFGIDYTQMKILYGL